jgi:DNA-binding MarR family transcriptional regulator
MHQETSGDRNRSDANEQARQAAMVMNVMEEAVGLFFRLRAVMEDIHGHSEISGSMRGVLRDLTANGPLTVPQLARRRPVSRQHIQAIVNELLRADLVELAENPRHKRSRIVKMTPAGEKAMREILERERAVLDEIDLPVSESELGHAQDVLRRLRQMMEDHEWRNTIHRVLYQDGEAPENPWIDETVESRRSFHRN